MCHLDPGIAFVRSYAKSLSLPKAAELRSAGSAMGLSPRLSGGNGFLDLGFFVFVFFGDWRFGRFHDGRRFQIA
jgi:hypothetical protein